MTTRYSESITNALYMVNSASGTDGRYESVNGVMREKWNDYTATFRREVRIPGRSTQSPNSDQWWNCSVMPTSIFSTNDILTLQSRLSEAVKGHSFNLAVSAAEGKKTVAMVTSAIQSIGGAIIDLKKGRFESAARRLGVNQRPSALSKNDVAGRWLELQYGWKPLISDVYESAKAYEALTNTSRSSRVTVSMSRKGRLETSASPANWTCKGTLDERWRIIYEMNEQMTASRSLGLMDPLSVAWELIPYSFVVDWFIPVGSYLDNLSNIPQLNGRFLTIKVRNYQGTALKGPNPFVTWIKYPVTNTSTFYMERVVSGGLSVPKPAFESLPDAMSPSRIWNALALVTQRLR